jgi:hypothetical protein
MAKDISRPASAPAPPEALGARRCTPLRGRRLFQELMLI